MRGGASGRLPSLSRLRVQAKLVVMRRSAPPQCRSRCRRASGVGQTHYAPLNARSEVRDVGGIWVESWEGGRASRKERATHLVMLSATAWSPDGWAQKKAKASAERPLSSSAPLASTAGTAIDSTSVLPELPAHPIADEPSGSNPSCRPSPSCPSHTRARRNAGERPPRRSRRARGVEPEM